MESAIRPYNLPLPHQPQSGKKGNERAYGPVSGGTDLTPDTTGTVLEERSPDPSLPFLVGWRLYLTVTGYRIQRSTSFLLPTQLTLVHRLMLGIFLSIMEVSIVSTALVDIMNELHAFKISSWVVNT